MSIAQWWDKMKWYFAAALGGIVLVVLFVFGVRDSDLYEDMFEVVHRGKENRLKKRKAELEQKAVVNKSKIKEVDKQIEEVQKKRETIHDKAQEAKPEQVAKEFVEMGY